MSFILDQDVYWSVNVGYLSTGIWRKKNGFFDACLLSYSSTLFFIMSTAYDSRDHLG